MRAKVNKEVLEKINYLFSRAGKIKDSVFAKRYVIMARQIAKRNNVKLPGELRRKFCHKCNSFFNVENTKIRIRQGKKSVKCLACGNYVRYGLEN